MLILMILFALIFTGCLSFCGRNILCFLSMQATGNFWLGDFLRISHISLYNVSGIARTFGICSTHCIYPFNCLISQDHVKDFVAVGFWF